MTYYPYMNMNMGYNGMSYLQSPFDQCYSTLNQVGQGCQQPYPLPATPDLPVLSDPSVKCGIYGCNATLPVERERESLAYHLIFYHGYLLGDFQIACGWKDGGGKSLLLSSNFNIDLSTGLQPNATAPPCQWNGKGINLLDHIVNSHLNFVDLCSKCGSGPFSRKSSLDRHKLSCQGRVPARCRDCLREFPSIIALGGHAELGLCRPMS
jgi:hypothetical protein